MPEPDLNPCNEPGYVKDLNIDGPPPYCREEEVELSSGTINKKPFFSSQKDVASQQTSWLEDATQRKTGYGHHALCDPQQTGNIVNPKGLLPPNYTTVYRYAKTIRGTDEAVMDLFRNIVVIDEAGKSHNVPIIWGTQEKAVAFILQENTRKDESLVVDRIRLPILAIHSTSHSFNAARYAYHKAINYLRDPKLNWKPGFTVNEKYERDTIFGVSRGIPLDINYTLYAWTMYEEDMNQIVTQIVTKFSPLAYIRVRGIAWEIAVKLNSISSNTNIEPGDNAIRIIKYQFDLTAESYVAQPIVRKKAVLKTQMEIADGTEEDEIAIVLKRLEDTVKELQE